MDEKCLAVERQTIHTKHFLFFNAQIIGKQESDINIFFTLFDDGSCSRLSISAETDSENDNCHTWEKVWTFGQYWLKHRYSVLGG